MEEQELLPGDGGKYETLLNAAARSAHVPGIVCEIGTRLGGSIRHLIDGTLAEGVLNKNVICIDPYGGIDYLHAEQRRWNYGYTNDMRNTAWKNIYSYVEGKPINVVLMCMEDIEFFLRYADGVPFYQQGKEVLNTYSMVFFDGPHDSASVQREVEFFAPRSIQGTVFVFDDIWNYHHDIVHQTVIASGFEQIPVTEGDFNRVAYVHV
jgi:cephalosporin hydroxylase